MDPRPILLVTQYDGGRFAGWQRQPVVRTVQGDMEVALARLCATPIPAIGAGRTDAGVHAHGQGVGVRVPSRWNPASLRRAINAVLPDDIWVAEAHRMVPDFHPRRSAIARRYDYLIGTDEAARSPFRRRYEWAVRHPLDPAALQGEADSVLGEHTFRAFAVANTAPADDHHRCIIQHARWVERDGGWVFEVAANRFLHHMVRFLVSEFGISWVESRDGHELVKLEGADAIEELQRVALVLQSPVLHELTGEEAAAEPRTDAAA
jgi:tRNA pseudouridine38-40 synthase